jgi:hypothetical protein
MTAVMTRNQRLARELTPREHAAVLAEHDSEATIAQIARRFTLTEDRVTSIWAAAGKPPRSTARSITMNAEGKRARAKAKAEGGRFEKCRDCGRERQPVRWRLGSRRGFVCVDREGCRAACAARTEERRAG